MPLDRRAFGRTLAAGAAAAAPLLAACGATNVPESSSSAPPPPAPANADLPAADLPVEVPAAAQPPELTEAELLLAQARLLSPDRLGPADLAEILRQVRGNLARGKLLSTHGLTNGDEPAPAFAAYRGSDA